MLARCVCLSDVSDELYLMRERGGSEQMLRSKHLEVHIYVTNTPADAPPGGHGIPPAATRAGVDSEFFGPTLHQSASGAGGASSIADGSGSGVNGSYDGLLLGSGAVRAPFTTLQLYRAIKNPTSQPQQLSDVHVHRGMPLWSDLFNVVSHRAMGQTDIGCIYSAGPICQRITAASGTYLTAAGIPAPSPAQLLSYQRTVAQLKEQCAFLARQSGKKVRFHTDLDV